MDGQRRKLLQGAVYSAPALILLGRSGGLRANDEPLPSPCGDVGAFPCLNSANPGPDDQELDEVIEHQGDR